MLFQISTQKIHLIFSKIHFHQSFWWTFWCIFAISFFMAYLTFFNSNICIVYSVSSFLLFNTVFHIYKKETEKHKWHTDFGITIPCFSIWSHLNDTFLNFKALISKCSKHNSRIETLTWKLSVIPKYLSKSHAHSK